MKKKLINKIAIIISWPRELDIYSKFILESQKKNDQFEIIVNDIKSFEKGRNESNKIIKKILIENQVNFKLFSEVYNKFYYKIVVSTGELSAFKISSLSILKFFYAQTIGRLLDFFKISNFLLIKFGKPFTAGGKNNRKLGDNWFPEKKLGKVVVKFPDGADLKLKNYPYKFYEPVYDIFLSYTDLDLDLIKKKFSSKICKKISYFRHLYPSAKQHLNISEEFGLDNRKKLVWIPTHFDNLNEEDRNIIDWAEKISYLMNHYNLIIRPHPKSLLRNKKTKQILQKFNFKIDEMYNRNISKLISEADLVISDYGGIIFDAIYLNKKIILLNMFEGSQFVKSLIYNNSIDIKVREKLICFDLNNDNQKIFRVINDIFSTNYEKKIQQARNYVFGMEQGLNFYELLDFLNNYEK